MTDNICQLPSTGGIAGLLIGGLFVVAGVAIVLAVRRSRVRLSVIAALPLIALIGVQAPTTTDPCVPASTVTSDSSTTTDDATSTTGGVPTSEVISELPSDPTGPPTTTQPSTTSEPEPESTVAIFGEISP